MPPATMYQRVGGDEFFDQLTKDFYASVAVDPVLGVSYPVDDPEAMEAAQRHLRDFLIQFWGGPQIYNELRGHPRLRMRHVPFRITVVERDAWVRLMSDAVRAQGLSPMDEGQMLTYFANAATHMINAE